jgi:hypothetical protein
MSDPCDRKDPRNNRYRTWIDNYRTAAEQVAAQLKTTTENILGLSALESGWGGASDAEGVTGSFDADRGRELYAGWLSISGRWGEFWLSPSVTSCELSPRSASWISR